MANRCNFSPASYFKYGLWENNNRIKVAQYVQHHEIIKILPLLNRNLDLDKLNNKVRFFHECQSYGLPSIPVVASFDSDDAEHCRHFGFDIPKQDLFIKYSDMCCGIGAERWIFLENNSGRWQRADITLDQGKFLKYCLDKAKRTTVIVQPNVRNHPAVAQFSRGGLCTLRVVTYKFPGHEPEMLVTSWRMPTGHG